MMTLGNMRENAMLPSAFCITSLPLTGALFQHKTLWGVGMITSIIETVANDPLWRLVAVFLAVLGILLILSYMVKKEQDQETTKRLW
jgi:hypothetical protein